MALSHSDLLRHNLLLYNTHMWVKQGNGTVGFYNPDCIGDLTPLVFRLWIR